ncbi:outer membrane beta-barrel protein [Parvularcula maris]|uniref:Porin family protein n=1 Tax=Parvularcula maris TaxID=2965077 RepID=A0A9X2L9S5_9PROT|nr:porin family protein [Parvularcula maris]
MKKPVLISLCSAVFLTSAAHAQSGSGPYVQLHGGYFANLADEIDVTVPGALGPIETTSEFDYGGGFAFGGLVGFHVTPAFALEGEITYRSSDVDSFRFVVGGDAVVETGGGSVDTVAFMANGVYRLQSEAAFTPYVGGGIGYATIDRDDEDGIELDGAFAYQLKAGADFPLGAGALGGEISYFGTTGFEASGSGAEAEYDYRGISVMATYKLRFGS